MLDTNKIDSDILEEIIQLCEKAMIGPLSKNKPEAEVIVGEEKDPEDDHDMSLDANEEEGEPQDDDGLDVSDDDMESMLEEYKRKKG